MTKLQTPKTTISPQGKGKVEMLGEAAMKQRLRHLVPRAIERLKELMESRNDAIAMGAAKLVLNKFVADLKITELQGNPDRPLGVVILPKLNEPENKLAATPGTPDQSINQS